MSAQLLRDAAQRIREVAADGSPWPWVVDIEAPLGYVTVRDADGDRLVSSYEEADFRPADANLIAMLHPGVALAIATMLESIAQEWADMERHNADPDLMFTQLAADEYMDDALALARLVLGEKGGA